MVEIMDWLESKYIGLVSGKLRNYKRKSGNCYNFSCPFCGDSTTDLRKARGYLYEKKGKTLYYCHNCLITHGFDNFIKNIDYHLYSEYKLERLKDGGHKPENKELDEFVAKLRTPVFLQSGPLKGLKKVSQLDPSDPVKRLVVGRKIPNPFHAKLFKCPKFFSWSNEVIPGKFDKAALKYDECRLLIPFLNKNLELHAFQGRAVDSDAKTRYITIVNNEEFPKVWGLDQVDFKKKVYVTEGPIDAMFLPNSIATAGGDLASAVKDLPRENMVIVLDNEPRSKETREKIDKAINQGYNVCVWPRNFEHKDVNDAVMAGLSSEFVQYIIDTNTFRDLKAKLALNMWSKM